VCKDWNSILTPEQEAIAAAFQSLIEDHLLFVGIWFRWCADTQLAQHSFQRFLGPSIPKVLHPWVRRSIVKTMKGYCHAQGISRLAKEDVLEMGKRDIDRLSIFLGEKQYMMGTKQPVVLDAVLFGILVNTLYFKEERDALGAYTATKLNLVDFTHRMLKMFFPERFEQLENQQAKKYM
jgi:hypothetical protein